MSGTEWVKDGGGATVTELCDALLEHFSHTSEQEEIGALFERWTSRIRHLIRNHVRRNQRTNLSLTGQPLVGADLERIASDDLK